MSERFDKSANIFHSQQPEKCLPSRFTAPDTIYSALVRGGSHTSPMGVYYRNVLKHCGHKEVGLNLDTLPVSTRKIRA